MKTAAVLLVLYFACTNPAFGQAYAGLKTELYLLELKGQLSPQVRQTLCNVAEVLSTEIESRYEAQEGEIRLLALEARVLSMARDKGTGNGIASASTIDAVMESLRQYADASVYPISQMDLLRAQVDSLSHAIVDVLRAQTALSSEALDTVGDEISFKLMRHASNIFSPDFKSPLAPAAFDDLQSDCVGWSSALSPLPVADELPSSLPNFSSMPSSLATGIATFNEENRLRDEVRATTLALEPIFLRIQDAYRVVPTE